jgi:hypothetical protein
MQRERQRDAADAELRRLIREGFEQGIAGRAARRGGRAVDVAGLPDQRRPALKCAAGQTT